MSTTTVTVWDMAPAASLGLIDLSHTSLTETQVEPEAPANATIIRLPRWKATLVIATIGLMTMMSTILSGVLAVALPKIAETIGLTESLLLWSLILTLIVILSSWSDCSQACLGLFSGVRLHAFTFR